MMHTTAQNTPRLMFIGLCTLAAAFLLSHAASAATVDELQEKIEARNEQIAALEKEIAEYQSDLNEIAGERQSLENEIRRLDISRRKLAADIELTQQRINATVYEINNLTTNIADKESRIGNNQAAIKESIRRIAAADDQTLVEALLTHDNLAQFWEATETLRQFQTKLKQEVATLRELKAELEAARTAEREKQHELLELRQELRGQKAVLDENRAEKQRLLTRTQNREDEYQKLLAEKREQKAQFEKDLFEFESQLKIAIDPDRIPPAGAGILSWPLPDPSPDSCWDGGEVAANCITQYFGKTSSSGRLYKSGSHNGMDFRATPGTRVSAPLAGTVQGTGDTDRYNGCYSYGKWVLIRHNNGLSTLFAHLSHVSVSEGDELGTGDLVGLTGNTGYSTGPHLHMTVYATQGVEIRPFSHSIGCKEANIPLAPRDAYLDPLSYL